MFNFCTYFENVLCFKLKKCTFQPGILYASVKYVFNKNSESEWENETRYEIFFFNIKIKTGS